MKMIKLFLSSLFAFTVVLTGALQAGEISDHKLSGYYFAAYTQGCESDSERNVYLSDVVYKSEEADPIWVTFQKTLEDRCSMYIDVPGVQGYDKKSEALEARDDVQHLWSSQGYTIITVDLED